MNAMTDVDLTTLSPEDLEAERAARQAAFSEALSTGNAHTTAAARNRANAAYAEIDRRARGGRIGATPPKTQYPLGDAEGRLHIHPKVTGRFALDKGLWQGRKVAAVWLAHRGDYRHRTDMRVTYGTLDLTAGNDRQIGVRLSDGQAFILAASRVSALYDMTRTKGA